MSDSRTRTTFDVVLIAVTLYLFMVGIGAMSVAFKSMGEGFSQSLFEGDSKPFVALFIGILATTLAQSSSTTTSIVVGAVAAGVLPFDSAVYMVMGANVGTTVTNTIVSLGHITRSNEYQRAFAAATVHDVFNLLVLIVLFPLQWATGGLTWLSHGATEVFSEVGGTVLSDPIKLITAPGIDALRSIVSAVGGGPIVLLVSALTITFAMLILMVKTLKRLMLARLENLFDRIIFRTPIRGLLFGVILTILVQSSSITTSIAIPLVGAGVLTIAQVFPYTMGANIGTTITSLLAGLAALAAGAGDATAMLGVQLAFAHFFFNIFGVAIFWKLQGIPIAIANAFSSLALRNRLIPIVYIVVTFYIVPAVVIWIGG